MGCVRQLAALRRWRLCRLELLRFRRALHVWQHAHALQVTNPRPNPKPKPKPKPNPNPSLNPDLLTLTLSLTLAC